MNQDVFFERSGTSGALAIMTYTTVYAAYESTSDPVTGSAKDYSVNAVHIKCVARTLHIVSSISTSSTISYQALISLYTNILFHCTHATKIYLDFISQLSVMKAIPTTSLPSGLLIVANKNEYGYHCFKLIILQMHYFDHSVTPDILLIAASVTD